MISKSIFAPVVIILCETIVGPALAQSKYGSFPDQLDIRLSRSAQEATLLADFSYIDPDGKTWTTPKGTKLDGASIPQILWTPVGSPWTGEYKESSVIHDYLCVTKSEPWKKVHRLFYTGMLANGTGLIRAKIMYAAVYRFGPRWKFKYTPKCPDCAGVPYEVDFYQPKYNEAQYQELKGIAEQDTSLDEIEKKADAQLTKVIEKKKLGKPVLIR